MDSNNMNQQSAYQQTQYQQTQYQQPVYQQPQGGLETPMTVGDWMVTTLIFCIPCINIIMLFVWAFSSNTQKSKANFCKATLIWAAIVIGLELILWIIMLATGATMFSMMDGFLDFH